MNTDPRLKQFFITKIQNVIEDHKQPLIGAELTVAQYEADQVILRNQIHQQAIDEAAAANATDGTVNFSTDGNSLGGSIGL